MNRKNKISILRAADESAYNIARKNGWLPKIYEDLGINQVQVISDGDILSSGRRYKSKVEWRNSDHKMYRAALRRNKQVNGFFDVCCAEMPEKNTVWTDAMIIESAKPFKYYSRWRDAVPGVVSLAKKRGIFDACCQHMEKGVFHKRSWKLEELKESARKYDSRYKWRKYESGPFGQAKKRGLLDECCQHMIKGQFKFKKAA